MTHRYEISLKLFQYFQGFFTHIFSHVWALTTRNNYDCMYCRVWLHKDATFKVLLFLTKLRPLPFSDLHNKFSNCILFPPLHFKFKVASLLSMHRNRVSLAYESCPKSLTAIHPPVLAIKTSSHWFWFWDFSTWIAAYHGGWLFLTVLTWHYTPFVYKPPLTISMNLLLTISNLRPDQPLRLRQMTGRLELTIPPYIWSLATYQPAIHWPCKRLAMWWQACI